MGLIDLDQAAEAIAKQKGLSKTLVKLIINDCYDQLRIKFKNPQEVGVLLHKLGTFEIETKALKALIHQKKSISNNPERLEHFIERLEHFIEVLNKSIKYHNNGNEKRKYTAKDFT
jgi:nucleoid DNA-binding protein